MVWQLQEAKQRLSEVVRRALEVGPQVVSRHGRAAVVVVSVEEWKALKGVAADFKGFMRAAPNLGRLSVRRDRRPARRVTL